MPTPPHDAAPTHDAVAAAQVRGEVRLLRILREARLLERRHGVGLEARGLGRVLKLVGRVRHRRLHRRRCKRSPRPPRVREPTGGKGARKGARTLFELEARVVKVLDELVVVRLAVRVRRLWR